MYVFLISSILSVILFRFVPIPFTPLMVIRVFEQWIDGKPVRLIKDWESIDHMSKNIPWAMLTSEDRKFTNHWGFDTEAIAKAYKHNQSKKRKALRGGSTISQQVAKNVFLWPGRSYIRKGFEAYFTILIETFWSKKRIMEVYLNVAEMGDGYYGVEAASRKYFHCSASKINPDQAAWLACILPSPRKFSIDHPTNRFRHHQAIIRREMENVGTIVW